MLTKVRKWGKSQGLRLTKALLTEARIHVGDDVDVSVREGQIIVQPLSWVAGRNDLKDLLTRMPKDYQPEEVDWRSPTGKEAW